MYQMMKMADVVSQLTFAMGPRPWFRDDGDRANKLISFAKQVSEEVLLRAGFKKPEYKSGEVVVIGTPWSYNQIAVTAEPPDENRPADILEDVPALFLRNAPTSLDLSDDDPPIAHDFVFCKRRVIEWDGKRNRAHRVLTYEEAARFILFWLAEKILQIVRKNEWDRVRTLPGLCDQLMMFIAAPPDSDPDYDSRDELDFSRFGWVPDCAKFAVYHKDGDQIFMKVPPSEKDGERWNAVGISGGRSSGLKVWFEDDEQIRPEILD